MRPLPLLVALSLAANAALVAVFALRPALLPPAVQDWFTSEAQRATAHVAELAAAQRAASAQAASEARAAAAKRAGVWASLQTDDLKTLVARLRAAGFSPLAIRAIVNSRLNATVSSRMSELAKMVDLPYWRKEVFDLRTNPQYYETRSQIFRERTQAMRELLGDDYFASGDITDAQRRQFGDLPKSKIDLMQRVIDDYADMASQVKAATQGITLPEDRAKLALLETEKRKDLAGILSPEELENYEMRTSPMLNRQLQTMTVMDATEAEFTAIYRAQKADSEFLYPDYSTNPSIDWERQREAQAKAAEAIKAALGAQRYADYARANNWDYQNLYRLAQKENVPPDAVNRAYDLRDGIAKESIRLLEDASLSGEQRTAALKELATRSKAQVAALVGSPTADAYAQSNTWLSALAKGYGLRVQPNGDLSYESPPPPNPRK